MLKATGKSTGAVLMVLLLLGCAEGLKTDWKIAEKVGLYLNKSGQLKVSTLPRGADIYLDGLQKGKSPISLDLSPGEHTIDAKIFYTKKLRLNASKIVTTTVGKTVSLEVKLKKEAFINSVWVPFNVFVQKVRGYRSKAQGFLENKAPAEAHLVFVDLQGLLKNGFPTDVLSATYGNWERLYRIQIRRWFESGHIGLVNESIRTYREISQKSVATRKKLKEFERRLATVAEKRRLAAVKEKRRLAAVAVKEKRRLAAVAVKEKRRIAKKEKKRLAKIEAVRREKLNLNRLLKKARTAEKERKFARARKLYRDVLLNDSSNRKGGEGLLRVSKILADQIIANQKRESLSAPLKKKSSLKNALKEPSKNEDKKKSQTVVTAEKPSRRSRSPEIGDTFKDCDDCPEMVVVPKGTIMMGSPLSENGRFKDEGPIHTVSISRLLAVGKLEVSFKEWDACVSDGGCTYQPNDAGWGRKNQPVINVGWGDAQVYLSWLNNKTGKPYRLLSEAEWEYIARAGTNSPFWWGNNVGENQANCKGCGSAWDDQAPAPVGSFKKNPFGLYDTHGNVLEWTADCLNGTYEGAPLDGSAWIQGNCDKRVLRGGAWNHDPTQARSASRNADVQTGRDTNVGFRVCFSIE